MPVILIFEVSLNSLRKMAYKSIFSLDEVPSTVVSVQKVSRIFNSACISFSFTYEFPSLVLVFQDSNLFCCCFLITKSCLTLLRSHRLQHARLLCPWYFPARILEWFAISFFRRSSRPRGDLQEIFKRSSNLHLPHWQVDSLPLSHQGSPQISFP